MGTSILKTILIYFFTLVISLSFSIMLILLPTCIHHGAVYIPGAYDTLYLSKYSPYDTIIVEVDCMEGMSPDPHSLALLQQQIEQYSNKKVVIYTNEEIEMCEVPETIIGDDLFQTIDEIQEAHRDYHTDWLFGNITVYIMYLDIEWYSETDFLTTQQEINDSLTYSIGLACAADSIIIFKEATITNNMETSVLLHEMGHIWGLDHSDETSNVMNSLFIFQGDSKIIEYPDPYDFPLNFSNEDEEHLLMSHESYRIIPIIFSNSQIHQ